MGDSGPVNRSGPVRTCVGCRRNEPLSDDLLRVVAVNNGSVIVPDRRRAMPGRGAWVHRNAECVRIALERKAFPRSLRVGLNAGTSALNEFVAHKGGDQTIPLPARRGGGVKKWTATDENTVKSKR